MPNEYFIHVICLLSFPTEMVWSMYGINMYDLSDLPNKVTYSNWKTGMLLNRTKKYKFSHNHNINLQSPRASGRPLNAHPGVVCYISQFITNVKCIIIIIVI